MLSREAAKSIIEKISSETKHYATVFVGETDSGITRFANSEITQNVSIANTSVEVTVYDGKREATCSTNDVSGEGLKALVKETEALLAFVPEGEYEPFIMSQELIEEAFPDRKLAEAFNVTQRAARIKEGIGKTGDGFTAAGALTLDRRVFSIGDTKGAFRYAAFDKVSFNTVVTHDDGSAGAGECCSFTVIPDIAAAFEKASATAAAARDPVGIDLGAYSVVLSPVAFGDLILFVTYMMGAESVEDGDSFTIGKMGEQVFGENLTIRDDSTHPDLLPMRFDQEGNARKTLDLVNKGVLRNCLYDNKLAARHKTENTGHAVSNKGKGGYPLHVIVEGGAQTAKDIISGVDSGIYINEFHYTNFVNPRQLQITGLTRNGTFLIENGAITKPITTMRFTVSLLEIFNAIKSISNEREKIGGYFGISLIPTVRIDDFRFTSKP
jgi:predicted Zn-dependent protease